MREYFQNGMHQAAYRLEGAGGHDLRHTLGFWHLKSRNADTVLQEMGSWSTPEMVRRYAHLSAAHLAQHAERIVPATLSAQTEGSEAG